MNNQLDNNNQINNNYNQNNNMQNNIGLNPATQQFQQTANQSSIRQQPINNNSYNQEQNINMQNDIVYNPATQRFQTVNQSSMSQQPTNNNQMSNNLNQNSGISENLKKYRRILHNDSVILLILSIVSMIAGLIFAGIGTSSGIDLFMASLFYAIFLIIIVEGKNKIKKSVGILSIVVSSFMILFALINHSLFDVMYFVLAIIYIIHAIQYLKNTKGYIYVEEKQEKLKIDKLKNISLILIIMCAIYPILAVPLSFTELYYVQGTISIVLFLFSSTSLVLNIILFIKKRKSTTLYVCSVFSIIIALLSGNYAIYDAQRLLAHYTNYDTEEDKQYLMEKTKRIVNSDVESYLVYYMNEPLPNTSNTVLISKEMYEETIRLSNQILRENQKNLSEDDFPTYEAYEYYKNIDEKVSIYEENEKKGYVCDGYTVVQRFYSEQECMNAINDSSGCRNYDEDFKKGKSHVQTFIKCTGRYEYQTEGFDEEKLNRSKNNKEEYFNLGFKELEYNFNQSVLDEFEWNLRLEDITYKIIKKSEYESEIIDNSNNESEFAYPKYKNYMCDGYVEVSLDSSTNEYIGKPYISCNGENNYQTVGFDNAKLLN